MPSELIDSLPDTEQWESVQRLTKDLRASSRLLGRREARYLVDAYYAIQDFRIQAAGQVRASSKDGEPNRVLEWIFDSMRRLEGDVQKALGEFASRYVVGEWLQSITGIGPCISAGILANFDVRGRHNASYFWSFAGLDPSVKWEKKQKRPWCAAAKVLLYKAGESFVKFQNHKSDYYGQLYRKRKDEEIVSNESGKHTETCKQILSEKNFGRDTDARKHYEAGHLPPAHVHARARRWVEKLFLSHVHHVMHEDFYKEPPMKPYAFSEHCSGEHRHFVPIPNWPFQSDGVSLTKLLIDEPSKPKEQNSGAPAIEGK